MAIASYEISINEGPVLNIGNVLSYASRGMLPGTFYSFRVRSKDTLGNVSGWTEYIVEDSDELPSILWYRVNCGPNADVGSWLSEYVGASPVYYLDGSANNGYTAPAQAQLDTLVEPAPEPVWSSNRAANPGDDFTYEFPVTASKRYLIRLHLTVKTQTPWTGSYPMTVTINGVAQTAFDPFVDAGSPAVPTGIIKEYTITQGVGSTLTINFAGDGVSYPVCWGLEVREIRAMAIENVVLAEGNTGTAYSQTLTTSDEVGAVTWALYSGSLPSGLSLNTSTGVISGTPTLNGLYQFTVSATDSMPGTAQVAYRFASVLIEPAPGTYLIDSLSASPAGAYSTRKLRSGYAGPCLRIERSSDLTQQDIGFYANGNIDMEAVYAFATIYDFTVVKWYDQTTNAKHAQGNPNLRSNYFLGKRAGLDYGTTGAIQMKTLTHSFVAVQPKVFMAAHMKATIRESVFFWDIATFYRGYSGLGNIMSYNGNAYIDHGKYDGGRNILTWYYQTGNEIIRIDGVEKPALSPIGNAGDPTRTGVLEIGNIGGGSADAGFNGVIGEFILYLDTISNSDRDAIELSQKTYFIGDSPPTDALAFHYSVVFEGDSLTFGLNAAGSFTTSPAIEVRAKRGTDWRIRNVAKSSETLLGQMTDEAFFQVDPYFDSKFYDNILCIWGGINDIINNASLTGATLYSGLQTYVAARKASFPALKVIVTTLTPVASSIGLTAGQQTAITDFNTLVRANYASFADGLCDLAVISALTNPNDTTIYYDGLHFTVLAYEDYIGPAFDDAIMNPAMIDGLALWLKADAITGLVDGNSVTTWTDSSGNSRNATQATAGFKPIYKTSIINGKPVVRFDSADDRLTTSSISAITATTVLMVVKNSDTTNAYALTMGSNSNALTSGFNVGKWAYHNGTTHTNIGDNSTTAFQIISTQIGSTSTGAWIVGADTGIAAAFGGDIAEILVYDSVLSAGNFEKVKTYLRSKYAIS